jgi:beta-galactosidase
VEEEWDRLRESLHVTSYDVAAPPWGYTPDVELEAQHADKSILGSFVWTGWDYLGEPTPYKTEWPSRSSYFGIVDLAGIPKDRYYLYQAAWIKEPVLHLLPHWTWPHRDGEHTPVHCYTNCASVELFVNGRSLGERRLRPASLAERWRLIWNDVRYEPGELVAIGRGTAGEEIRRVTIPTAGAPSRVTLCPEASTLEPRDDAMAFVRIAIQDENGTLCPQADHAVEVTVEGDAELVAMCAGDQTSVEPFQANPRGVFRGEAVAYVRGRSGGTGEVVVRASANGLRIGETLLRYAPAGHAAAQ